MQNTPIKFLAAAVTLWSILILTGCNSLEDTAQKLTATEPVQERPTQTKKPVETPTAAVNTPDPDPTEATRPTLRPPTASTAANQKVGILTGRVNTPTPTPRLNNPTPAAREAPRPTVAAPPSATPTPKPERETGHDIIWPLAHECWAGTSIHADSKPVPCTAEWTERVLGSFQWSVSVAPPSYHDMLARAIESCDRRTNHVLQPPPSLWSAGERTIACIQAHPGRYGGPDADPQKSIFPGALTTGECFRTDNTVIEIAPCSQEWQYRTKTVHAIPPVRGVLEKNLKRQHVAKCGTDQGLWDIRPSPEGLHGWLVCAERADKFSDVQQTTELILQAEAALNAGNLQEALELAQRANQFNAVDTPVPAWMQGTILSEMGRYQEAIEQYTKAIAIDDRSLIRVDRAWAYTDINQNGPAKRDAKRALELELHRVGGINSHLEANSILSLIAQDEGNFNLARDYTVEAIRLAQEDNWTQQEIRNLQDVLRAAEAPRPPPTEFPVRPPTPTPPPDVHVDPGEIHLTQVRNHGWTNSRHPTLANDVAALPWVTDGLTGTETEAVEALYDIAVKGQAEEAARLLRMAFFRTPYPGTRETMEGLARIVRENTSLFKRAMASEVIRDGISREEMPLIAALAGPATNAPHLVDTILTHAGATVEEKAIITDGGTPVRIAIVRTRPGSGQSITRLEEAVRISEDMMGLPFPREMAVVLYSEAVIPGFKGTNYGPSISIKPEDDTIPAEPWVETSQQQTMDHEVAHYYWSTGTSWISEGMATYAEWYGHAYRGTEGNYRPEKPCTGARVIKHIPNTAHSHACDYYLGNRLFFELSTASNTDSFLDRMAGLYALADARRQQQTNLEETLTIEEIETAFTSPEEKKVIDRWYHGKVPYDRSSWDLSEPDPELSFLSWKVQDFRLVTEGNPISSYSSSRHPSRVGVRVKLGGGYTAGTAGDAALRMVVWYEDGWHFLNREFTTRVERGTPGFTWGLPVWTPIEPRLPAGQYLAHLYENGKKVAQTTWTVTE